MNTKKQAFTLVELLIVTVILIILGSIAIISFQGYSKHARNSVRISDIKNTEKVLNYFVLNTGKYPRPGSSSDIIFSGGTIQLWNIGDMDKEVQRQLNQLSKIPKDPKTGETMSYATTLDREEYELKYYFEVTKDYFINNTYASSTVPYIQGNYNKLYLLGSDGLYYAAPGLHTQSLDVDNPSNFEVHNQIISYQVSELSYSGLVLTDSNKYNHYTEFGLAVQKAYSGVTELSKGIYKVVSEIDNTSAGYLAHALITGRISEYSIQINGICGADDKGFFSTTPVNLCNSGSPTSVTDAGEGSTYTWVCNGESGGENQSCTSSHTYANYPNCDATDITIASANGYGPYTIAACNIGTSIAGTDSHSYGGYVQFGRTDTYENGTWTNGNSSYSNDWKSPGGTDAGSANDWGVLESENLTATYSSQDSANQTHMQGPCPTGYHVPTNAEWVGIIGAGGWSTGPNITTALQLPFTGYRSSSTGNRAGQGSDGYYWSSSPKGITGYVISIHSSSVNHSNYTNRSNGFSIRCFKN